MAWELMHMPKNICESWSKVMYDLKNVNSLGSTTEAESGAAGVLRVKG